MSPRKPGGFRALADGLASALQWRLLLAWALGLLLPTLVATLPLWRALADRLDHSTQATALASRLHLTGLIEAIAPIARESGGPLLGAGLGGLLLALLLSPWLTGMVVTSIRAGQPLNFAHLLQGGLREYGRMFRMLLWAAIPIGVALVLGALPSGWAERQASHAVLENGADNAQRVAIAVLVVLLVFAHATVEAGRAVIAADPARRSVVKAWWQGLSLVLRRPVASLGVYLGATLASALPAAAFAAVRTQLDAGTPAGFIAGLVFVQLLAAAIAWGRIARLYGLAELARYEQERPKSVVRPQRRADTAKSDTAPEPAPAETAATSAA